MIPISRFLALVNFLVLGLGCQGGVTAERREEARPDAAPSAFAGSKAGEEREVAGVKLCWCPAGKFTMGSPPDEPERRPGEDQVEVTLTQGFWAGKFEVTQGQWKRVIGKLPGELTAELPEGDSYPVGSLNFAEAEAFCQKLTVLAQQSGELPNDWEFRLPTEAQWEYACRAGTTTATCFRQQAQQQAGQLPGQALQRRRERAVTQEGGQGRELPSQPLGAARHARQHLRVVPRLVPCEAARRRRSRPVLRTVHDTAEPKRRAHRACAGAGAGPTTAGPAGQPVECRLNRSGATTTSGSVSWRCSDRGWRGFLYRCRPRCHPVDRLMQVLVCPCGSRLQHWTTSRQVLLNRLGFLSRCPA